MLYALLNVKADVHFKNEAFIELARRNASLTLELRATRRQKLNQAGADDAHGPAVACGALRSDRIAILVHFAAVAVLQPRIHTARNLCSGALYPDVAAFAIAVAPRVPNFAIRPT